MAILPKNELFKIIEEKLLQIESLDDSHPFIPERQITEDSIDLRLSNKGIIYKNDIHEIDTLYQSDIAKCFEEVLIPHTGYLLLPGKVLFSSTLEVILLSNSGFLGRVNGRSTFARYGISIHCNQPKSPPGLSWVFPLQIINHNSFPVRIYSHTYMVQLQIETVKGESSGYDGKYDRKIEIGPPIIDAREKESIPLTEVNEINSLRARLAEVTEIVKTFEERQQTQQSLLNETIENKNILSKKNRSILVKLFIAFAPIASGIGVNLITNSPPNIIGAFLAFAFTLTVLFVAFLLNKKHEHE